MSVRTQGLRFVALAAVGVNTGCFSPGFERCAVTCGTGGVCPGDQVCLLDNYCHAEEGEELCSGQNDGGGVDGPVGEDGGRRPDAGRPDAADQPDSGPPVTPTEEGDLVITEIHKNPALTDDVFGEWFEVFNPSLSTTYDLAGLTLRDDQKDLFQLSDSLVIPPRGWLVFGRVVDMSANGGVTVDFAYEKSMALGNEGDEVVIENADVDGRSVIIDRVAYDDTTFPNEEGRSLSLDPDFHNAVANDDGTVWCEGQGAYNAMDFGSPREENPEC